MRGCSLLYHFPQGLNDDGLRLLAKIPGVHAFVGPMVIRNYQITAAFHAHPAVTEHLNMWQVRYTVNWVPHQKLSVAHVPEHPKDIPTMRPPAGKSWFPHQLQHYPLHRALRGGIAEWDGGIGKTIFGITWAEAFATPVEAAGEQVRIVVVTKANTRYQWRGVWESWTTRAPEAVHVLDGFGDWSIHSTTTDKMEDGCPPFWVGGRAFDGAAAWCNTRKEAEAEALRRRSTLSVPTTARILILSWPTLAERAEALVQWRPHCTILDESHTARQHRRFKRIIQPDGSDKYEPRYNTSWGALVLANATTDGLLALTGTPDYNLPKDWWAQLTLYDAAGWGNFREFAERYCAGHQTNWGFSADGISNGPELKARLQTLGSKVYKRDVAHHLPRLDFAFIRIPMAEQAQVRVSKEDAKAAKKRGPTAVLELRQCLAAEAKIPYIIARVERAFLAGQKVIIFMGRIEGCERLGRALDALAKKMSQPEWKDSNEETHKQRLTKVWWVHGEKDADPELMIQEYKVHAGPCVFLSTLQLCGEAVDGLQYTDLGLYPYFPYTPGMMEQGIWRLDRLNRDRPSRIEFIEAEGTSDGPVLEALRLKLKMQSDLGDSTAGNLREELAPKLDEPTLLRDLAASILRTADQRGIAAPNGLQDTNEDAEKEENPKSGRKPRSRKTKGKGEVSAVIDVVEHAEVEEGHEVDSAEGDGAE